LNEIEVTVVNRLGLHARAASRFAALASRFRARVLVAKAGSTVDGKSVLGLMTLAACRGTSLLLRAEGVDAEQALGELARLVRGGFGEGESS
jgi:phosphocarrier protein